MLVVDEFGKVTVSLGGVCTLGCRHCYTMTSSFRHARPRSVAEVVKELGELETPFNTICVSGDTDCFLDEDQGVDLVERVAEEFGHADVLFTTRLVPSDACTARLVELGRVMRQQRRLLIPGISFVSLQFPNRVERARSIARPEHRLAFMETLHDEGLHCLAALRPTFPFSLVPQDQVDELLDQLVGRAGAVLGEVFILDPAGQLAKRLALPEEAGDDRLSNLSFLDQPQRWRKRSYPDEVEYTRHACRQRGLSFFLRSGTALDHLRELETGQMPPRARLEGALDTLDP